MYTNIRTDPALREISAYLRDPETQQSFPHYNANALIAALEIVFKNNIFRFGDTTWRQISGTGMGISPAPPWATIFYALHENVIVPKWKKYLFFFRRFIDDIFGIWLKDPDPTTNELMWNAFQADLQKWHGLEWVCTEPSSSVNFMDLTISISGDGAISTTLYEKEQNLYLYLPPHSSHPKGVRKSLINGQILRIRRLCSSQSDADSFVKRFLTRLTERGHAEESLLPLFSRAEENAKQYLSRTPAEHAAIRSTKERAARRQVYLHLDFHPEDPPSHELQSLWREFVAAPPGQPNISEMRNCVGEGAGIDKLIVAYSRPANLRNEFSVRNIDGRGKPVSTYLAE
jgi:hypothetical protein